MKKNLYFRTVYRRENLIREFLYDLFLTFASYPKLLLEVFIRKNFGQRYFSISSAITFAVILFLLPSIFNGLINLAFPRLSYYEGSSLYWKNRTTWDIFVCVFLVFSLLRWNEVRKNPSVFDFARFSLYTGDIHPLFYKIKIFGVRPSARTIEIFFEPVVFFILGQILALVGQHAIGNLLMFSSVFYSLSYAAQYKKGDDFVMDKIDEIIMNEEQENAFVNDVTSDNARGVRFYARKPKAKTLRQKLTDSFVEDDVLKEEVTYAN